ncbi:hypothetical protein J6590_081305 [Homalodisca vitripennis]|nr:hypothetical protein J6590_081305 [Homalodisca vitripennis]
MLGFNRVPVSAVNRMVRRVCPMVTTLKQTLNALALPALPYRHPTGASVFILTSGAPTQTSSTTKETECVRPDLDQIDNLIVVIGYNEVGYRMTKAEVQGFWFSFRTVSQANCTRLDIDWHRLYAGSTGSFADFLASRLDCLWSHGPEK